MLDFSPGEKLFFVAVPPGGDSPQVFKGRFLHQRPSGGVGVRVNDEGLCAELPIENIFKDPADAEAAIERYS